MLSHLLYGAATLLQLQVPLNTRPEAGEQPIPGPECVNWDSHFHLSRSQIERAGISDVTANNVNIATEFERTNWAHGSVGSDPFYSAPPNSSFLPAGSLLKVEQQANVSAYTLPADVALSRILFQTSTLNGTAIPASAFVLWPYSARKFDDVNGIPVVVWAHGTSGIFAECGPSNIRNLWYHFYAPFILALQGYVVVAPDYAGLGLGDVGVAAERRGGDGQAEGPLRHPYLTYPSHADDLFYAVQAAQQAFPALSHEFVVMGHSQGGGAAWAAARRQAVNPVPGYLGSIAASPGPGGQDLLELATQQDFTGVYLGYGVSNVFPREAPLARILTEAGLARFELLRELGGCSNVADVLFATPDTDFVHADWTSSLKRGSAAQAFAKVTDYAGKRIAGPLLVLQGTGDPLIPHALTERAVARTCWAHPDSQIELAEFEDVSHNPVLHAGQRVWLDWIADRFGRRRVRPGCTKSFFRGARAEAEYLEEIDYSLELIRDGVDAYEHFP